MSDIPGASFTIDKFHRVDEVGAAAWDGLSNGAPFQSARWYRFGECAMQGCEPTYLVLKHEGLSIARAALWRIHNEPLPVPAFARNMLETILKRWPLLICRSPLSNVSGLILPEGALGAAALSALAHAGLAEAQRTGCSFVVFDFVAAAETKNPGWPRGFIAMPVSDPGTVLQNRWTSLEDYLAAGNKKDRQHYKRVQREADALGLVLSEQVQVSDVDAALTLMRNVERKHGAAPNPWLRGMLDNLALVNGAWLTVQQKDRLVGGGLILEDNGTQLTTALGLVEEIPFVYFVLVYASLQDAFARRARQLRWGSGAYDVKRRLGFELEDTNHAVCAGTGAVTRALIQIAAYF